ncbi:hypothetical protein, partial [Streptomyces lonarensis]|uniref:hypothetical protein n=1 Tax=Streptomyces lonarensis TaxID=700599 RepID=UPI0030C712C0
MTAGLLRRGRGGLLDRVLGRPLCGAALTGLHGTRPRPRCRAGGRAGAAATAGGPGTGPLAVGCGLRRLGGGLLRRG